MKKGKCVCFCWANRDSPIGVSVGVSLLSSELAEAGFEVQTMHWHESLMQPATPESVAQQISQKQPDILLVSFGTNQAHDIQEMLAHLKEMDKTISVLAGGVHPTLQPEEVLGWGNVDYVFVGEADGRIVTLVSKILEKEDLSTEPNLALRFEGRTIVNESGPLPDISAQSLPYWDGFDYASIISRSQGFVNVISGRGCPFRCAYCHNSSLKFGLRKRSVANMLEELRQYKMRYGEHLQVFNFGDDMFVADIDWLEAFAERYVSVIGSIPFAVNATLNYVRPRTAKALALAGCYTVRFGLETGSERLRKLLQRPDSLKIIRGAVRLLQAENINLRAYVMVGIPTETKSELFSTFALASELEIDSIRPSIFFPYPGTPAYEFCKARNLLAESWNVGNYFDETVLTWDDQNMRILVNNAIYLQNILLNANYLKDIEPEFQDMHNQIYNADMTDWQHGLVKDLQIRCFQVLERLRKQHIPHYTTPIAHRPELCFLLQDRAIPIPNIDWSTKMSLAHLQDTSSVLSY